MSFLQSAADRVHRAAQHRQAPWLAPALVGGLTLVALLPPIVARGGRGPAGAWLPLVVAVVPALVLATVARLGVATWRRLWREPAEDRWSQVVYGVGLRRFVLPLLAIYPLLHALPLWWLLGGEQEAPTLGRVLFRLWYDVVLWWGLGLWLGYGWGVLMARVFRIPRPDEPRSDPRAA